MMTIEELSAAVHEPAVVERFSHLVREAAGASDGRVLKQIGDEFMLVFPSSTQATACGSSIMAKVAGEDQFPDVRLGAHAGHALYRDGDYLGGTVNVAARVASQAVRGQFLVTDLIRQEIAAESGITFKAAGRRSLKGVGDEVELFEVVWSRPDRPVDPVCGMAIDPESGALTLEWRGAALRFCSPACHDRFVENPALYSA